MINLIVYTTLTIFLWGFLIPCCKLQKILVICVLRTSKFPRIIRKYLLLVNEHRESTKLILVELWSIFIYKYIQIQLVKFWWTYLLLLLTLHIILFFSRVLHAPRKKFVEGSRVLYVKTRTCQFRSLQAASKTNHSWFINKQNNSLSKSKSITLFSTTWRHLHHR